jgi:hypothetical protein
MEAVHGLSWCFFLGRNGVLENENHKPDCRCECECVSVIKDQTASLWSKATSLTMQINLGGSQSQFEL